MEEVTTTGNEDIERDNRIQLLIGEKRNEVEYQVVLEGLEKLAHLLHKLEKEGGLPTAIVFPDTGSRPLYYAIKPLIDTIYSKADQKTPSINFVKTIGSDSFEGGTYSDKLKYLRLLNDRLREVLSRQEKGGILLIDDLLSRGETLNVIKNIIQKIDSTREISFFVFAANPVQDTKNTDPLKIDNLTIGQRGIPDNVNKAYKNNQESEDNEIAYRAWSDFIFQGFSHRLNSKRSSIGVRKDKGSQSPYSEPMLEADMEQMRALRQKYSAIGEEALQLIDPVN